MKFHTPVLIAFSTAAVLAAANAQAAVTVLGNGAAHSCYEFAELGGNLEDGCFNATLAMAG